MLKKISFLVFVYCLSLGAAELPQQEKPKDATFERQVLLPGNVIARAGYRTTGHTRKTLHNPEGIDHVQLVFQILSQDGATVYNEDDFCFESTPLAWAQEHGFITRMGFEICPTESELIAIYVSAQGREYKDFSHHIRQHFNLLYKYTAIKHYLDCAMVSDSETMPPIKWSHGLNEPYDGRGFGPRFKRQDSSRS